MSKSTLPFQWHTKESVGAIKVEFHIYTNDAHFYKYVKEGIESDYQEDKDFIYHIDIVEEVGGTSVKKEFTTKSYSSAVAHYKEYYL